MMAQSLVRVHGLVGVPCLVRAVEGADPEVDDAYLFSVAVVAGPLDPGGEVAEGRAGQPHNL
jgi:hypothetical protein